MSLDRLVDLLTHMEWADAQTWRCALACSQAGGDAFLRERLHHIHMVQWAYLHICRGETVPAAELEDFPEPAGVRDWARRYYTELPVWLEALDDPALDLPLRLPWADRLVQRFGLARPVTLGEGLMQVVMHSAYHRGQVATRLRQLGGEPELTDYIVWLWRGRPSPEWGGTT